MSSRPWQCVAMRRFATSALLAAGLVTGGAWAPAPVRAADTKTIAVMFDGLTSEFLVAGMEAIEGDLKKRGYTMIQQISNRDQNVQLEQVKAMIAKKVNGIIIFPTDANGVIPAIRAANAANVPMVHFNRQPADSTAYSPAVVADNRTITKATVQYMVDQARKTGKKYKAAILIGDLGDVNALGRRDGFFDAVDAAKDVVEVVARIPTEWNADKAFAGLTNAMQANPDINFLFASSDFMFPLIEQVLKPLNKWHPVGHADHVILGGFDGDSGAYNLLHSKYLDADGVQDLFFEAAAAADAIDKMNSGGKPAKIIPDPGFSITQANLDQVKERMWGYTQWLKKNPK
jgi:ABC-type sugar transport system substrate-binding protein